MSGFPELRGFSLRPLILDFLIDPNYWLALKDLDESKLPTAPPLRL